MRFAFAALILMFGLSGCGSARKRTEPPVAKSAIESSLAVMSLRKLDEAALVLKVAFNKSLESWQGGADDIVAGCRISGKDAERGLAIIGPRLENAVLEEAKRLVDSPKTYRLPIDEETCERDCSCGLALGILEKARLDEQSHSRVKEFKRIRARLEAKSELITSERAEICSDAATWICSSEFLKALKP